MLFNSTEYLFFFILASLSFFLFSPKFKWIHLLTASIYFYSCWRIDYTILLIATIIISYYCALEIDKKNSSNTKRKILLGVALGCNFGQLFFFKYFDFFVTNINSGFSELNIFYHIPLLQWVLPIGISFHTFQISGYLIDIYRKEINAEKHLGIFSLFVCFFPQLVAGPIEKGSHLIPQLKKYPGVSAASITQGLQLMLWGAFQKIVIADNLSVYVGLIFDNPQQYSFVPTVTATLFFTAQIYCDFCGYTNIARGTAKVLGYDLMINFNKPMFSNNVTDFWRRWHISLSNWFKNYIYIPLGGNKEGNVKTYFNLFVVFLVTGFWHGASWHFVIWGLFHGFFLIIERLFLAKKLKTVPSWIQHMYTLMIVLVGWVFFRAKDMLDAIQILKTLFTLKINGLGININDDLIDRTRLIICFLLIAFLFVVEFLDTKKNIYARFFKMNKYYRWIAYFICIWMILLFGKMDHQEFIYFQF
jgi:alginate O-acetyltransferase complex protein AlgI